MPIPEQTIARLSAYRRQLRGLLEEGKSRIFSHELASLEGVSPAQVRRDLMVIGYTGSPAKGYDVAGLIEKAGELLDSQGEEGFVLVGLGRLGKAILAYFTGRHPHLRFVAAFDNDPTKTDRVIHGVHCHALEQLEEVVHAEAGGVTVAVIAVPAEAAQSVADRLVHAGVKSMINFAPVRLRIPDGVHVETVDLTVVFEKVAYLARQSPNPKESLS